MVALRFRCDIIYKVNCTRSYLQPKNQTYITTRRENVMVLRNSGQQLCVLARLGMTGKEVHILRRAAYDKIICAVEH